MSNLAPLVLTIGTFLVAIGLTAAIAADLAGSHGHFGHLLALAGMVCILGGVVLVTDTASGASSGA